MNPTSLLRFFVLMTAFLLSTICNGQHSLRYALVDSNIDKREPKAVAGDTYGKTDYSKVTKPLILEHIKTNCGLLRVASDEYPAAGNRKDVVFGGDLPSDYGNPSCVFTKQTFDRTDFPICLETNVFSRSSNVSYNENYFWIGPANYDHFASPSFNPPSNHKGNFAEREGVAVGGRPHTLLIIDHDNSSTEGSVLTSINHNLTDHHTWYNYRVILDLSGGVLQITQVYIDGKSVLNEPYELKDYGFLSNYRLAVTTDDMIEGFKIVTNFGQQDAGEIVFARDTICHGDSLDFTTTTTYDNDPNVWYEWEIEGGNPATSDRKNPGWVSFSNSGNYQVRLIVGNGSVQDTIYRSLIVSASGECCEFTYYIPNAFSPNGKGPEANETFSFSYFTNSCDPINNFIIRIYDLWGGQLFESNDPYFEWPGIENYAGVIKPSVYVWVAEFNYGSRPILESGTVTMMR